VKETIGMHVAVSNSWKGEAGEHSKDEAAVILSVSDLSIQFLVVGSDVGLINSQ